MTFSMNRQKIEVYLKQETEDIQHEQREDKDPSKTRDRR
jgi:hypothetical protein